MKSGAVQNMGALNILINAPIFCDILYTVLIPAILSDIL